MVTGGKDSTLALHRIMARDYQVECLVAMIPLREDSWMFHYPNIRLVDLFADAVGMPLVKAETCGIKEREVEDLKHLIGKLDVEGIVCGAIASTYQKKRIEAVCRQYGLKPILPLWHEDELDILNELLDLEFEVLITGVYAYGFDQSWLGRRLDTETVQDLMELNRKYGVSLVGEGGEYETWVVDAPLYSQRIRIVEAEKLWEDETGYLRITDAELEDR